MNITEAFIKGSNNLITLTLTEDDVPISTDWTELAILIYNPHTGILVSTITRTSSSDGVIFSGGILTINPGLMTELLTELVAERLYRVKIRIKDAGHQVGVWFGDEDSKDRLYFIVTAP